jgi:Tol biopolymer transport system component
VTTGVNALSVDLSKDGRFLAYPMFLSKNNVWSIAIPGPSVSSAVSIAGARPLTTEEELTEGVSVSRDGQWIAFDSNRSGNYDIYRMPRTGGRAERLTTDSRDDFMPSWSPDGQSISDGRDVQQLTNDPSQERYPGWSPDGQSVVFNSDKEGPPQLFIVSREGATWGRPRQFTTEGGVLAKWSPDGRYIAYLSGGIRIMAPSGGVAKLIVPRQPSFAPEYMAWSSDSQTIYFKARDENNRAGFWSVPVSGGPPRHLVRFDDAARPSPRFEFAADDREFFFTMSERDSDIWLLDLHR